MKMVKVVDGEIVSYRLPTNGKLRDGSTVINYHLLDDDTLKEEGWLPLEDDIPEYDPMYQHLTNYEYVILEDKVIKKYTVEDIQSTEPEIIDEYVDDEKIAMAEAIIDLESRLAELEKLQGGNV